MRGTTIIFRPSSLLLCFMVGLLFNGLAQNVDAFGGLSDFGGDVSQYMSLLQGSSAFSFKPGSGPAPESGPEDEVQIKAVSRRRDGESPSSSSQGHRSISKKGSGRRSSKTGSRSESAMGDFGGDYGSYLQLLEGDSALGFNPQSDPIADNQDLQSDVFGGGMSGKFWDMYKGSSSYDSFDESDADMLDSSRRQSPESDQPEDEPNPSRGERGSKKEQTVIVAIKPSKSKVSKIFSEFKSALKMGDKIKMGKILDSLNLDKMIGDSDNETETVRKILFDKNDRKTFSFEEDEDDPTLVSKRRSSDDVTKSDVKKSSKRKDESQESEDDDNEDDYSKESQKETEIRSAEKNFEEFVDKMRKNMPDPIATNKGLSMSYRNLTLYGLTDIQVCGKIKMSHGRSGTWTSNVCVPRLTTTIDCVTGPGVPFRGKVAGIFKEPKLKITFRETGPSSIHIVSVKTVETSGSKFVPTYDSSIPLNPWSKVSLIGYMVARVKKMLPSLVDQTILKITHVVESLTDD